jgi:hypothetical protein
MRQLPITRVLLSLLLLCATVHAADSVSTLAEGYEKAAPADAVTVSNLNFSAGHLKLQLQSGRAAKLMAGTRTLGFYFKGSGSFTYQSLDPIEFPVMKFNLKRTSFAPKIEGATATITGPIDEVIVWTGQIPELKGVAAASLAEELEKNRSEVSIVIGNPVIQRAVVREYEAPSSPVTVAELTSGKDRLVYSFDPLDTKTEQLNRLFLHQSDVRGMKNYYSPSQMSTQYTGHTRRESGVPRFQLADLTYTLVNPSGEKMVLDAVETLIPMAEAEKALTFTMEAVFYKQNGSNAVRQSLDVIEVKDEAGNKLATTFDQGVLVVGLNQPAAKGRPLKLTFHLEGDVLIHPGGDSYWQADSVFPMPPEMNARFYTIHSTIKTKAPFVPLAPGDTVARRTEGDMNVLESKIEQPVENVFAMAGKYTWKERTENGLTIRVHTYALSNDTGVKKLTDLAFATIKYYENFLGPFPFKEFNIIQINSYGYGIAPPATMYITNEAFRPAGDELTQLVNNIFSEGVNERFAHEIAHQYWGHNVKVPTLEESWLSEAFAEYTAALFLKKAKSEGDYNRLVNSWKSRASQARDAGTIPTSFDLSTPGDYNTEEQYQQALRYFKGAFILSRIHKEIGDVPFLTFMKSYQTNFHGKFGATKHVIGILGAITKKDWNPYFEQYYWGTAMPE